MTYTITKHDKILKGSIQPVSSKSISNRVLIIQALCDKEFKIQNLSTASDTQTLQKALHAGGTKVLDVNNAGTAMRFLTAYLANTKGEWILTGDNRMQERPIGALVSALKSLGAVIEYLEKEGYPPLLIKGKKLAGTTITVNAGQSSQFVSALLMIAPVIKNGLKIFLKGKPVSEPYIQMTLKLMAYFGVKHHNKNGCIEIPEQKYKANDIEIEADWSAAAYYYEMAAFADKADLKIKGVKKNSWQGDTVIANIFEQFGVATLYTDNGIILRKQAIKSELSTFKYDCINCPDLVQTIAVTCAGLGIPAEITGIEHLKAKETDRIQALKSELTKAGISFKYNNGTCLISGKIKYENIVTDTHNDHRMAMAFAPLAILTSKIKIDDPLVVIKSYPGFWEDTKKIGFNYNIEE